MTKTFGNFTDLMDFSRASTATFLGSDGLIQTAAADTPRIEYATDGTVRGLLIEEARTNLITNSEAIGGASWYNSWGGGTTLTANAATAPDGTTTAVKLEQIDGGGDGLNATLSGFSIDSYYTISCFLKNEDADKSQLNLFNNSSNEAVNVLWNGSSVSSITTTGSNVSNAGYDDVGNGWIRVYATVQVKATSANPVLIPENITGNTGRGAYFWGAQVEQGSFPTSYIPTSGATATRSADNASINVQNFGYNQDEGTVVVTGCKIDRVATVAGTEIIMLSKAAFNTSDTTRIFYRAYGATGFFNTVSASTNVDLSPSGVLEAGQNLNIAFAYAKDDFAAVANGGTVLTDTSGALAEHTILQIGSGQQYLNGHIRDVQYYPRRLTNRQLQELTGATNTYDYTTVEAGTITRSPVATGSDLVGYSGFGSTNYLEQPYNSDLDFGTGDFCVMGWNKCTSSNSTEAIFIRQSPSGSVFGTGSYFYLATYQGKILTRTSGGFVINQGPVMTNSGWHLLTMVRRSGVLYAYVNGELIGSVSDTSNLDNSSAVSRVGAMTYNSNIADLHDGEIALLRISATAPTAEQIAKIYEDEKVLFQEGAQATLYGSSDAVTALAHDDTTNLLHVGTSAGRSVFQGLRRVENTTDAVGTAISASNGLVVEE